MADAPEDGEPPVPPRDDVLRKREFQKAKGIDLSSFMVEQEEEVAQPAPEIRREEVDEAVGEIASMFSTGQESERGPGAVLRDGTVANAPELDSVEDLAVHGERRLSLGLLVAMVTVWSAIGAVVGTVLPPVPSGLGLMSMGLLVLYLEESWIPRPSMPLLGVTWCTLSMNLFYGLALDSWY